MLSILMAKLSLIMRTAARVQLRVRKLTPSSTCLKTSWASIVASLVLATSLEGTASDLMSSLTMTFSEVISAMVGWVAGLEVPARN